MADDVMKYSDLISPDNSIDRLISELKEVNRLFGETIATSKASATEIKNVVDKVSGATRNGREVINTSTIAANRLKAALRELAIAESETGQQIAIVRAETAKANRETVAQQKYAETVIGSYDRLKADLKEMVGLYKSLSAAERAESGMGLQLLDEIRQKAVQIQALDRAMKPHIQALSDLEKAERKLAYLQSEEGGRYLDTKAKISALLASRREQKALLDKVAEAEQKLTNAQTGDAERLAVLTRRLQEYNTALRLRISFEEAESGSIAQAQAGKAYAKYQYSRLSQEDRASEQGSKLLGDIRQYAEQEAVLSARIAKEEALAQAIAKRVAAENPLNTTIREHNIVAHEANRIAQLTAQLNTSAEGSYNRLAAQYELNKIKLNAMSAAERQAEGAGKELEQETLELYERMMQLQEATGNYRLSVGHYQRAWDGLGMSVSAIVREIPAATVSMNTFFLAISNNVPLFVDEVIELRKANEALAKSGKPTVSITKSIISSLLSWNTLLVVGLTLLSQYGEQIIDWAAALIKGKGAAMSYREAVKNVNAELENTNDSFGDKMATLKKLQFQWKELRTEAEKTKWLKDNQKEFQELGLAVDGVNDAEKILVTKTTAVVKAFTLRARAAAAQKLAAEKYEEYLKEEQELNEELRRTGTGAIDAQGNLLLRQSALRVHQQALEGPQTFTYNSSAGAITVQRGRTAVELAREGVAELRRMRKEGDQYAAIAAEAERLAEQNLSRAGIKEYEKKSRRKGQERQPTDLTDRINKQTVALKQKQAEAITQLEEDELKKRERQAADAAEDAYNELQLQYNKNLELLAANLTAKNGVFTMGNKKYKQLTDEQVEQVRSQQAMILDIIKNNNIHLNKELEKIELERQKRTLELEAETIKLREDLVQKGTSDYIELKLKALENEYKQLLIANKLLPEAERQSETLLAQNYIAKLMLLLGQLDQTEFEAIQKLQRTEFEASRPNERKRRLFERQQEIDALDYEITLAEQGSLALSPTELAERRKRRENLMKDQKRDSGFSGLVGDVAEYGLGGAVLSSLGFDEDALAAAEMAKDKIIGFLEEIMEANIRLAEIAVEKQQEQVDAAKEAYDAEVTARANGYANNVTTARKELELEKKKLADKNKQLEKAKRAQLAADTAMQTSALITASAEIWKSMSGVPIVGPALAAAALAAMWSSFAFSKVKAVQVTKAESQTYGEGGLEFLEGGSHASGNDIDLAQKNSKGKNMRAEGGEALAIINKRNTRKYKKELPSIIKALNKGSFEDVYTKAFDRDRFVAPILLMQGKETADLSRLEREVSQIRKQGEHSRYSLPDGSVLVINKNVRRIIKR